MHTYEYHCPKCGENFERQNSVDKRHKAKCPKCQTKARLIPSRFMFRFEGGV